MAYFLLTVQSQNRAGIVADVSQVLAQHHINIMDSSMTTLRHEFVMMLILSAPHTLAELKNFLKPLKASQLSFFVKELKEQEIQDNPQEHIVSDRISVTGEDQTGIVAEISQIFAKYQINILEVSTRLLEQQTPPLYTMLMDLNIPKRQNIHVLKKEFQDLEQKMNLDIHLQPILTAEI